MSNVDNPALGIVVAECRSYFAAKTPRRHGLEKVVAPPKKVVSAKEKGVYTRFLPSALLPGLSVVTFEKRRVRPPLSRWSTI